MLKLTEVKQMMHLSESSKHGLETLCEVKCEAVWLRDKLKRIKSGKEVDKLESDWLRLAIFINKVQS